MREFVLGTRGSDLALTQSRYVAARLMELDNAVQVRLEIITSKGDKITEVPLAKIGAKGVFTKELELALLDKSIDLAVHSLKDLPTELPAGLCIGAIPQRVTPNDVLVSATGAALADLPPEARVGTSSLRRKAQLLAARPDLEILDIRGNVPTRIQKMRSGQYDATILAAAGMERLDLTKQITEYLKPEVMLPAVGQGALAIEIRQDDAELAALLAQLHNPDCAVCVDAERALLQAMGGGCQVPIGALAEMDGETLTLTACVCSADGKTVHRLQVQGTKADAVKLGQAAAEQFKALGGDRLLARAAADAQGEADALKGARVVLTRSADAAGPLSELLSARGAEVFSFPCIAIQTTQEQPEIPTADAVDWLVFTSANAVNSFEEQLQRAGRTLLEFQRCNVCAVGPATARVLQHKGMIISLAPETFNAESMIEALTLLDDSIAGKNVLLPRGNLARPLLPDALRDAGANVTECVVYETTKPDHSPEEVQALLDFKPNMAVFTSSSTAKNFSRYFSRAQRYTLQESCAYISIGAETSKTLDDLGMPIAAQAAQSDSEGIVHAAMQAWKTKK